jgi:photosystem II stability/assembly factor-like uncharacterized protein
MSSRVPSLKGGRYWARLGLLGLSLFLVFHLSFSVLLRYVQAQEDAERHWIPISENRVATWEFSPNYDTDPVIYVGTAASEKESLRGIYRSTDHGYTWENSSEGLIPKKRHYYTDIEFSPDFAEDQTIWLTGHKTGLGRTEPFGGMWQSTDGGNTWTEIEYQGFPYRPMTQRVSQDIIGLELSPNLAEDSLMIAAAGGEGVYISTDKGLNWEISAPIKDVLNVHVAPTWPDEPFVALSTTGSKVMISTDGGKTFETRSEGLPESMSAVRGVIFSDNFAEDRTMFCWGANGVYVSRNAGESWEPVVTADQSVTISCMDAIGDFSEYGSIAYGTDGSRVFLSDDMGQTFKSLNSESLLHYPVDTIAFPPDYQVSRQLFVSGHDGMFMYGPGQNPGAAATAQAIAANVDSTRVARATAAAGLEFVPETSDRVETGCIAYSIAPTLFFLILIGRRMYPHG